MNINTLLKLKTLNVEQLCEEVEEGSGTFKNLIERVYDGTISALINNEGDIIGLNYEVVDGNDAVEELKFQKAYLGKPVDEWVLKAFELYVHNNSLKEVIENENIIKVILNDDSEVIIQQNAEGCLKAAKNELPSEVTLSLNDVDLTDNKGFISLSKIKNYLRETYDYYLSGVEDDPKYYVDYSKSTIKITDIKWGRKR